MINKKNLFILGILLAVSAVAAIFIGPQLALRPWLALIFLGVEVIATLLAYFGCKDAWGSALSVLYEDKTARAKSLLRMVYKKFLDIKLLIQTMTAVSVLLTGMMILVGIQSAGNNPQYALAYVYVSIVLMFTSILFTGALSSLRHMGKFEDFLEENNADLVE